MATPMGAGGGLGPSGYQYPRESREYEVGEIIGYGASAVVYRATIKAANQNVALKMFHLEGNRGVSHLDVIRKEILQLNSCNHPNIISYYCAFIHEDQLWLVMELLSAGSCLDIMKYGFPDGMEEGLIRVILKETLKGIEYLHNHHRIHRDIKAGNILISGEGEVKLSDFGVSKYLVENGVRSDSTHTFVGTPCWMAPEVIEQVAGYDTRADIWSFGITAVELAKGKAPHSECAPMKIVMNILEGPAPRLEKGGNKKWSNSFRDFVETCLQKEPAKRPSASKLLESKFLKGAKNQAIKELLKKLPPLSERVKQTKNMKPRDPPPTNITIDFDFGPEDDDDESNASSSTNPTPAVSSDPSAAPAGAAPPAAGAAPAGGAPNQRGRFKIN